MATVTVTADNTRVEDAESTSGWTSIGGGAGGAAEGSFPYQGSLLYNRKVTSSTGAGFYYDPTLDGGSGQDMTSAGKTTLMCKFIVTDYGGLQSTNGVRVRIGSGTTAYHVFVVAGSDSPLLATSKYPDKGGVVIAPINPNVTGYIDSTSGSPVLSAVDYFGFEFAFSASTAKSENCGADAIDLGTGLTLVGGDGGDPDGNYQDYLAFDEGTVANRFGYVTAQNGVLFCYGMLTIGGASTTVFTDNDSKVLFLDGMFDSGWSGNTIDLQNASTVVNIGNTIESLGTDTVVDTRADFIVTGTSGALTFYGQLLNHRNIVLTSGATVNGGAVLEFKDLTHGGATINNAVFRTRSASGVAAIDDIDFTLISNVTFNQIGAGHAIEVAIPGTYSFNNLRFNNYGADGSSSAVVYNNSGGTVTINVSGGDSPTVLNGAGASTTIVSSSTITIVANVSLVDAEIRIYDNNGTNQSFGDELAGVENCPTATYQYTGTPANDIYIQIMKDGYIEFGRVFVMPSSNQNYDVLLEVDNN